VFEDFDCSLIRVHVAFLNGRDGDGLFIIVQMFQISIIYHSVVVELVACRW